MDQPIEGLVAAPFTPMHADGCIDLDTIDRHAKLLAANGVAGAFVCGSTGEGPSLTVPERMQSAETRNAENLLLIRRCSRLFAACLSNFEQHRAHSKPYHPQPQSSSAAGIPLAVPRLRGYHNTSPKGGRK